ncbi:immunity 53 family protein [Enterococcus sp. BWT-B8]|uniref:immunity 53 family protein n=1 Tax=Enterococcus sp. BWT-B8 TaxID=2885157 RepID=UPI001E410954|nr:immunity 53 family protein [Enterococcus sp. BWT-B8]MCB5951010.1 immunity 53 family protein [Enterococcus sp. BWT-B8]
MDMLLWLQNWYKEQCDGDWEHLFGIKIDTLDNPGWSVDIDLTDTNLVDASFETLDLTGETNWIYCTIRNSKFVGRGDETKLLEILSVFKKWVEENN